MKFGNHGKAIRYIVSVIKNSKESLRQEVKEYD
jgi:hypothetical protein